MKATSWIYRRLTQNEFKAITDQIQSEGGGSQTYIDIPKGKVCDDELNDFFGEGTWQGDGKGYKWEVPIYSLGLDLSSQTIVVSQRRVLSNCIREQNKEKRINIWKSEFSEFPTSIYDEATNPIYVFILKTEAGDFYAGWFYSNKYNESWYLTKELCKPFFGDSTGYCLFSNPINIDKRNFSWPFLGLDDTLLDALRGKSDKKINICKGEKDKLQQILFGAPGTGKSHTINSDANITEQNSIRTTFHPDSDYSTFVGCYKPTKDEKSGEITYDFTPQAFTNAYVSVWKDLSKPFYLIIEEINRGNCAQIFGDIFQLLDRNEQGYSSYKTTPDQDLTNYIKTQFSETNIEDADVKSGNKMQLPPNLHIWATMNTSDQSLFPIDSAFKRRWDWRYIPIDYTDNGHYIDCGDTQYSWADFLQKVNDKVESVTQSEDKKLGYWFMGNGKEQTEITIDRFVSKVVFYLWNDVFKDFGKSGNTIFKDSFGKFHLFFDSSGKPKKDVVKAFLDALEVAERKDIFTNEELNEASNTSSSRFTLNGERLSLKDIAYRVVENYAGSNPTFTATQIKTVFIEACKNCGLSHIVETDEEYQQRLSTQSSAERSQTSLKLNNGEIIHITTQWRAKKPEDNFFKFIEVCNKNNWGDIQKVEQ